MTLPTFKAAGTFTAGTGAITPPYPTGAGAPVAGDIALLVCESENQAISLSTAQGFVELGNQTTQSAGTAAVNPASRLAVFWKRCVGGDTAPTVADSGDHTTGRIYLFTGVKTSGNPWNVLASGNDGGANDTSGVVPGATTTVVDCLIVLICTSSYNGTSTAQFSGWTNSNLSNIQELGDNTNTAGLGGGHGLATGEKSSAGTYGNTTVTLAQTSYKGTISIALEPPQIQAKSFSDSGGGSDAFVNPFRAMKFSESGGGSDGFGIPFKAMRFAEVGAGNDLFDKQIIGPIEKDFSDSVQGSDVFSVIYKEVQFGDSGSGIDIFAKQITAVLKEFADAGIGTDVFGKSILTVILKEFLDVAIGLDVFAKEQIEIPPAPLPFRGGAVAGRRLAPCIIVTVDGRILLNLNMNKPVYMVIN